MSDTNESNPTNEEPQSEPVLSDPEVQAQLATLAEQLGAMQKQLVEEQNKNASLAAALENSRMEIPNGGHVELDEVSMQKLKNDVAKKNVRMITITIAGAEGEKNRPVFVGVQGVGWALKRGVKLRVPEPVVHVLSNAIKTHYNCDLEGNIESTEVPAYPFTVHL